MPLLGSTSSQAGKQPGSPTDVSTYSIVFSDDLYVSFTEPVYTGKGAGAVTYTATSSPGGLTASDESPDLAVSGLTPGTAYTFTVTASRSGVTSAASSPSSSATAPPVFTQGQGSSNSSGNIYDSFSRSFAATGAASFSVVPNNSLPYGWSYNLSTSGASCSIIVSPNGEEGSWSFFIEAFTAGNAASRYSGPTSVSAFDY